MSNCFWRVRQDDLPRQRKSGEVPGWPIEWLLILVIYILNKGDNIVQYGALSINERHCIYIYKLNLFDKNQNFMIILYHILISLLNSTAYNCLGKYIIHKIS